MLKKTDTFLDDSSEARHYPVFLNLHGKKCLIVGFGKVGRRKLEGLLPSCPACVTVLDLCSREKLDPQAMRLLKKPVQYECRSWRVEDLSDCFLAFACTGNANINLALAKACVERNILCNCATDPQEGNFIVPARARSGCLETAFSSSGASPLLITAIRDKLQFCLASFAQLASFMGLMRTELLKVSSNSEINREIFKNLLDSPFQEWLKNGEYDNCAAWLLDNVSLLSESQIENIIKHLKNDIR